jgi:adenylyltransferase/sulfurtransferase
MNRENLTPSQIERYSRQILLKDVGGIGQKTLLNSTVAIIGGGGLGCPTAQQLAAMGIGRLKIFDGDLVEISNLPRQPMHYTSDIGKLKVESLQAKIQAMNPDVTVEIFPFFVDKSNIVEALSGVDFVIEASDSIATKFLINDVCVHLGIPFTIAGVLEFFGQIVTVIPGSTCYRCIFHNIHEPETNMTCSGAGVMGTVPSFAGILQANEAIKLILGLSTRFTDGLFAFDLLANSFDFIPIKRDPTCKACSQSKLPFFESEDYGPSLNQTKPQCIFKAENSS